MDNKDSVIIDNGDLRFSTVEDDAPKKPLGTEFKKQLKKDKEQRNRQVFWNKVLFFKNKGISAKIASTMDFVLSLYAIFFLLASSFMAIRYFWQGDWILALTGCVFIVVSIYLNEKI